MFKNRNKKVNIKILVGYHVPYPLLKSEVYVPIHAGREVAFKKSNVKELSKNEVKWLEKNTIGDNTGDNISKLNRNLCEMTPIYWAWKNQDKLDNPDYIGYVHYRRHFIFKEKHNGKITWWCKNSNFYVFNSINYNYKNLVNEKYLYKFIDKYSLIVPKKHNFRNWDLKSKNPKDHFVYLFNDFGIKYYEQMENIIYSKYPEYIEFLEEYKSDCKFYPCNMIIAKKEIFNKYCEFIFPILFEFLEKFKFSEESTTHQRRIVAFIGEVLTSLFISKYKKEHLSEVKELDCTVLKPKDSSFKLKLIKTLKLFGIMLKR